MKNVFAVVVAVALSSLNLYSQYGKIDSSRLPQIGPHYVDELTFDVPSDEASWTKVASGLQAAFGSADELYLRREVPSSEISDQVSVTGWRGERLNAQVVIWNADTLKQVRVNVNDLTSEKGNRIAKKNISVSLVRYVLSNYPYGSKEAVCGTSPYHDGYLMPDRFESFDRFELPGKSVRPIWVSVNVPADAAPGTYTSTIDVQSESQKATDA